MARHGDCRREGLSDLSRGFRCMCDDCTIRWRCRDHNLFCRDNIFAVSNGYNVTCNEYQPPNYHGLEGVRP